MIQTLSRNKKFYAYDISKFFKICQIRKGHLLGKMKKLFTWVLIFQKYGIFWCISLGHYSFHLSSINLFYFWGMWYILTLALFFMKINVGIAWMLYSAATSSASSTSTLRNTTLGMLADHSSSLGAIILLKYEINLNCHI